MHMHLPSIHNTGLHTYIHIYIYIYIYITSCTCIPNADFRLRCTVGVQSDPLEEMHVSVEACSFIAVIWPSKPSILLLMASIVLCIFANSFASNCLISPHRSN